MKITVGGETREVKDGITIRELIKEALVQADGDLVVIFLVLAYDVAGSAPHEQPAEKAERYKRGCEKGGRHPDKELIVADMFFQFHRITSILRLMKKGAMR